MRIDQYRTRRILAAAVFLLLGIILMFAAPGKAFAADGDPSLQERHILFTYGYTECTGTVHSPSLEGIAYNSNVEFPQDFSLSMMTCDTDHVLKLVGDDITDDKVSFESMNTSVLEIDDNGNVTLKKTGSARIKATVAADSTYDERTVYMDIRSDKHEAWIDASGSAYYVDRPHDWGLDLDTGDGSHQIEMRLRPGAKCVCFSSGDMSVAYVDQNGVVTPVSAGKTMIGIITDDGGGRYKASDYGCFITVTGEDLLRDQEITGDIGSFRVNWRDGLQLDLHAETDLEYFIDSSDCGATVTDDGFVEFAHGGGFTNVKVVAPPNEEYKPAEVSISIVAYEEGQETLKERHVWFTCGCTDCDGMVHPCSDEEIGYIASGSTAYPSYYTVDMMMCDTDHAVHVEGDDLIEDNVTLTSLNPDLLEIDRAGNVTLNGTGKARIKAFVPEDDTYAERTVYLTVNIDRHGPYDTEIPFCYEGRSWGAGLDLDTSDGPQKLVVPLRTGAGVIGFTSDDPDIASVDGNGVVTPKAPGHTVLRVTIDDGNGKYKALTDPVALGITVTGKAADPDQDTPGGESAEDKAAEEAARKAAAEAARKAALKKEIARAKSLKRPSFKVKARKGHKNKLTWGKVANADGYIVYIRYPGRKKFVKAVTRNKTVKSVVHKGLSKGKVYRYKVRAYKKVKGKTYYGPYSKVRKVKAK